MPIAPGESTPTKNPHAAAQANESAGEAKSAAPTYAAARRRALLPYAAPKERLPAFRPNVRIPLVPQEQPPKYFVGMPVGHARESSPKKLSAGGTVRKR